MNLLFLGAGKRLSLLEAFVRAAREEDVDIKLFSVEFSRLVPVSEIAQVLLGPDFMSEAFPAFLRSTVQQRSIDLVIPNMDAATEPLAALKSELASLGCWAVVSARGLCHSMFDKSAASAWFTSHGIAQPAPDGFPCIAKSRQGFGSRDQFVARDARELGALLASRDAGRYFIQSFVEGQEYSVDAYVDRSGSPYAMLSRKRLQVVDGEVEVSETHHHEAIIGMAAQIVAVPGWEGAITLQFIDGPDGPVVIEVNPRFGGGVTHAIHCGLDMPAWMLRERLGRPLPPPPAWADGSVMTRCRRDVFHDRQR
jgi:carbamoyl-phosphate synthase large subunit